MRRNSGVLLFGLALIGVSIVMIGDFCGLWKVENFDGWWTLFLIIPGFAGIIKSGFSFWNSALILVGAWFLVDAQSENWGITTEMMFAVLLLIFGIMFIGIAVKRSRASKNPLEDNEYSDVVTYTAFFGGAEATNRSKELKQISLSAAFGGIKLDLSDAQFVDGAIIGADAIFGGIDIILPKGCKVKAKGLPIFGGLKNTYNESIVDGSPLIIIEYNAIFGGIDIK